jgi:hypothetical protein
MENWKELWLKNYRGEGDTAELSSFLKKLNYGNRNNVSYLPWATVERIFKLQDGKIEIVRTNDRVVESDSVHVKDVLEEGILIPVMSNAYFVNIKVEWHGQTHIEKYPIQDGSGRALSVWSQNEVNKSIQRGKVKAIAIISGIGFKLFEDGDLQFEETTVVQEPTKVKPVKEKPDMHIAPTPQPLVLDRTALENEIKKEFLSGEKQKADMIREYLSRNSVKRINELTDEDLKTLHELVVG